MNKTMRQAIDFSSGESHIAETNSIKVLKDLMKGIPLRGLSYFQYWHNIKTPSFPYLYTLLSILAYIVIFLLLHYVAGRRGLEYLLFLSLREALLHGGILLGLNIFLIFWAISILNLRKKHIEINERPVAVAQKTVYYSTLVQPIIIASYMINVSGYYGGDILSSLLMPHGTSFYALVIAPNLVDAIHGVLFIATALGTIARILCVIQGTRLSTGGSWSTGILVSLGCLDAIYFFYLNAVFAKKFIEVLLFRS